MPGRARHRLARRFWPGAATDEAAAAGRCGGGCRDSAAAFRLRRREAAAAAAAVEAQKEEPGGTAFLRSIVRRYEPVNNERANAILQNSVRNQPSSTRWSMTGQAGTSTQRPLGRGGEEPVVLDGVRRRPGSSPATADPAPETLGPKHPLAQGQQKQEK
jgi:hypothetical protein